jgi:hypothetical protein
LGCWPQFKTLFFAKGNGMVNPSKWWVRMRAWWELRQNIRFVTRAAKIPHSSFHDWRPLQERDFEHIQDPENNRFMRSMAGAFQATQILQFHDWTLLERKIQTIAKAKAPACVERFLKIARVMRGNVDLWELIVSQILAPLAPQKTLDLLVGTLQADLSKSRAVKGGFKPREILLSTDILKRRCAAKVLGDVLLETNRLSVIPYEPTDNIVRAYKAVLETDWVAAAAHGEQSSGPLRLALEICSPTQMQYVLDAIARTATPSIVEILAEHVDRMIARVGVVRDALEQSGSGKFDTRDLGYDSTLDRDSILGPKARELGETLAPLFIKKTVGHHPIAAPGDVMAMIAAGRDPLEVFVSTISNDYWPIPPQCLEPLWDLAEKMAERTDSALRQIAERCPGALPKVEPLRQSLAAALSGLQECVRSNTGESWIRKLVESALLRERKSLTMRFADIPNFVEALRVAHDRFYSSGGRMPIGRGIKAFTFYCMKCGQLDSKAILMQCCVDGIAKLNPQAAVIYSGSSTDSFMGGGCPGCKGDVVLVSI